MLVVRVTRAVRADHVDERVDETVEDRVVHVHALDGRARLPAVVERALGHRERGGLDVDVVADVRAVLAAELELQPYQTIGHRPRHPPAGRVRTGEAHHVDLGADERGPDGSAPHDRLHDVDGYARPVHEVDEP